MSDDEPYETLVDLELAVQAMQRTSKPHRTFSHEEIMEEFGITQDELDAHEVEID